jgi:hypothetical protein
MRAAIDWAIAALICFGGSAWAAHENLRLLT